MVPKFFFLSKKMPLDAFRAAVALPTLDLANVALADCSYIHKLPYIMPSCVTEKQVFTQEDRENVIEDLHQREMMLTTSQTFFEIDSPHFLWLVTVSLRTVRRRLAERNLRAFRSVRAPVLTTTHKRVKLAFSRIF